MIVRSLVLSINHDHPIVVNVAWESSQTVCRNLVLEVDIGDGRTDIVRMESLVGGNMAQLNARSILDILEGFRFVFVLGVAVRGSIENTPYIILIPVWVEGDLLFWIECQPGLLSATESRTSTSGRIVVRM